MVPTKAVLLRLCGENGSESFREPRTKITTGHEGQTLVTIADLV
jgi:hypothetical protein